MVVDVVVAKLKKIKTVSIYIKFLRVTPVLNNEVNVVGERCINEADGRADCDMKREYHLIPSDIESSHQIGHIVRAERII